MSSGRGLAANVALALHNVGGGLYLPVSALFLIQARGFSVAETGFALGVGTAIGLFVPAVAGALVDRIGARYVLASGQLLQAMAMGFFLLWNDWWGALVASAVFAAGTQMFYGSLFSLLSVLRTGQGGHDRYFALIDMVRAGAFGVGALIGAGLLAVNPTGLTWLLTGNLVLSAAGAVAVLSIRTVNAAPSRSESPAARGLSVLQNGPFLGLIGLCFLISVVGDFFPVAFPVVAVEQLGAPTWVPSLCVALLTIASSSLTVSAVHLTRSRTRAFAVSSGVVLLLLWVAVMIVAYFIPVSYVTVVLMVSTLIFAAGSLLIGTRLNAAAHDAAPDGHLGRYLAAFQYSFSIASLTAPLLLAAFAVAVWLPWLILALSASAALAFIPLLRRMLPGRVLGRPVDISRPREGR